MKQQNFTFETAKEDVQKNSSLPPAERKERQPPKIYTVSEIVGFARSIIEAEYSNVWISGEISGFKTHSSGHCYFILKDATSILPAAMFKGAAAKLKFKVEDGMEAICHGRLSLYNRGGQYQIVVDYVEPKGVGELQLAFEQLKKKLAAKGLFDKARKRPLPFMPGKIGIVTSPTGAAVRDMLKVLRRRFPNINVLIAPVRVQGVGSAQEIVAGIELLNTFDDIDLLIVGRGGGSLEDLWAFNEEIVAMAIFNSRIPVISAVGHEIDFTISDFVADFRAPTPSAAAEHAVPVKEEMVRALFDIKRQIIFELKRNIKNRIDRVRDLSDRLSLPTKRFPDYYRYIDNLKERMIYSSQVLVKNKENALKALGAELNHLSPLAVLSKGYSVVTKAGTEEAIRSAKILSVGDVVQVKFSEGSAEGRIEAVKG